MALHKKMKLFIKDFFSKYDEIRRKLQIGSHLLKKLLLGNSYTTYIDGIIFPTYTKIFVVLLIKLAPFKRLPGQHNDRISDL